MADLRIFSYLPNPRLFKATIAARYSGATIDIVGAKPADLPNWLWDYDARELSDTDRQSLNAFARKAKTGFQGTLYKTDAFLHANPFGDVPAAFGKEGEVGLFESNSIMRAAARLGGNTPSLYGGGPLQESRIDSFLDRTLIFARETQRYLLGARSGGLTALHNDMASAMDSYLAGIDNALKGNPFVAGNDLTLADIAFACEVSLLSNEKFQNDALDKEGLPPLFPRVKEHGRAYGHLEKLAGKPQFSEDLAPYFKRLLAL